MTGKEFEKILMERFSEYRKANIASIGRYGVEASYRGDDDIVVIQSKPDFEGSIAGVPTHVIFDAKVCSQASFSLSKYRVEKGQRGSRARQLSHMLDRSQFGSICGFLIHWNERKLKTRNVEAATYWVPVHYMHELWLSFQAGEIKSITIDDCDRWGRLILWDVISPRARKERPCIAEAIRAIAIGQGLTDVQTMAFQSNSSQLFLA